MQLAEPATMAIIDTIAIIIEADDKVKPIARSSENHFNSRWNCEDEREDEQLWLLTIGQLVPVTFI